MKPPFPVLFFRDIHHHDRMQYHRSSVDKKQESESNSARNVYQFSLQNTQSIYLCVAMVLPPRCTLNCLHHTTNSHSRTFRIFRKSLRDDQIICD